MFYEHLRADAEWPQGMALKSDRPKRVYSNLDRVRPDGSPISPLYRLDGENVSFR